MSKMVLRRTVGPKGQVVIPKEMRDALGLRIGTVVAFELQGSSIVLRPEIKPEEYVDYYSTTESKKFSEEVDVKRVIEEEVLRRVALHR